MFKLIIQDDEGKTTVVPLIRDEITIGRKEGNTIRLTERNVSRRHARILKSNGSVLVEDLESYNGVKVNGARIQGRIAVGEADRIQIGDYLLELKLDRTANAPGEQFDQQPTVPVERVDMMGAAPEHKTQIPTQEMPVMRAAPPPIPGSSAGQKTAQMNAPALAYGVPAEQAHDVTPPPAEPYRGFAPVIASPPRLVVVSSNLARREYVLDKPAMIIGRAEDSEIVIDHRSISRHHAKIVQEGDRFAIVDMQSANGLRVNGEEYGKVELRRGDLIDLGYVRFRYVEPGEDFVFDRDAQIYDPGTKGGSKGLIIGLVALLLVGGGVTALVLATRGSPTVTTPTKTPDPGKQAVTPPGPEVKPTEEKVVPPAAPDAAAAAVPAVVPDAAAPVIPPATPAADALKFIAEANQAAQDGNWMAAHAAAEQALKLDPTSAEATRLRDQAAAELRDQPIYDKFVDAVKAGNIEAAVKWHKQLPDNTSFAAKATPQLEELKASWLKQREQRARTFSQKGQCEQIERVAREVGGLFPEAKAGIDKIRDGCQPAVAEPTPPKPDKPPVDEGAIDAALAEAKAAARVGNYAESRRKVEEVLAARPSEQEALITGVIASCRLNDKDRALRYNSKLKAGPKRTMAKQICAPLGIQLP